MQYITTETSVILYWDLPEQFAEGDIYEVFQNGEKKVATEKCFYEANELPSGTTFSFSVTLKKADGTAETIGEISAATDPEKRKIDITKPPYNAVGDGKTLNTAAIQKAFDDCGAGECVYIPKGDFMTGALRMHSDMDLYIEEGGILHGTSEVKDYEPKIKSRFEGIEMDCYAALLNLGELDHDGGYNCKNVKIYGGGTICSGGKVLAEKVQEVEAILQKDYIASLGDSITEQQRTMVIPGRPRPRLVNISNAQNIVLSNLNLENGASWNVHMIYSDNIVTHGCTIRSEEVRNGDGWDPDSSTNCTLFGTTFYTGDDSVAIKSGKNLEGHIINRPCEHIRVFDCISHEGHGITVGSEMSGGVSDVRIWNCDVDMSAYGIQIKGAKKRGGYVRDVHVRNTKSCRIYIRSAVPYYDDGEPAPIVPIFENCSFENMQLTGMMLGSFAGLEPCNAIDLSGFDIPGHLLKNIRFKNIVIDNRNDSETQMIALKACEGITFENICVR